MRRFYTFQVNQQRKPMALIPAYKILPGYCELSHERYAHNPAWWTKHCQENGGFDPGTKTFYKLSENFVGLYAQFDAITAAVEAGYIDAEKWPTQLFKSAEDLDTFLEEVECCDQEYRIRVRWYEALRALSGQNDEPGFVTCEEIANVLAERAGEISRA